MVHESEKLTRKQKRLRKSKTVHNSYEGYIHLAAAILNSGIQCNDEAFLNSTWYKFLKDCVGEYMNTDNNSSDVVYNLRGISI